MLPKNSIKPLELVVSAIHCLRDKNGSSPQNILRYLAGKYNVDVEILKPHVQTGLKRGISFGIITQHSGLYRLNDILSNPLGLSLSKIKKTQKVKLQKRNKPLKRRKLRQCVGKKGKRKFLQPVVSSQKNKKKSKKAKDKKKKVRGTSRRVQKETNRRKQKQQRTKGNKLRHKDEKLKKVIKNENQQIKQDENEAPKPENHKNGETTKTNVKM